MKKITLITLILAGSITTGIAQVADYAFTQQNLAYNEITGSTVLWSTSFDDQVSSAVTIPEFVFNDESFTSIFISANGFITFGITPTGSNYNPVNNHAAYKGAVAAFGRDLNHAASGNPSVRYEQVGDEFVVQWTDVRRYNVPNERLSFQVRLNTADNTISVVYGGTITPGLNTIYPQVGLRGASNADFNNRMILLGEGNWINSSAGTLNSSNMYFNAASPTIAPEPGLTFTWEPPDYSAPPNASSVKWPINELTTFTGPVKLEWTSAYSAMPLLGYKVYSDTNPNPTTLLYDGPDISFQIQAEQYGTNYYWKVVPYNENGDAPDVPVWSFSTVANTQLAESFEDDWFPPQGWNFDSGLFWIQALNNAMHGSKSAYRWTTSTHAKFHTPKLSMASNSKLSFFAGTATSLHQRIQLYYSPDKIDWQPVGDEIAIMPGGWHRHTIDLAALAGNDYYLGLAAYYAPGVSGVNVFIDHVIGPEIIASLPLPAEFPEPWNETDWVPLQTTLKWRPGMDGGIPSAYKLYLGTDGSGTNTPINVINGQLLNQNSFDTPQLLPNTTYYWQIIPTNSAGDAQNCPVWSFTTYPENALQVGFGDDNWLSLPVNAPYNYSYSQNIYYQQEINMNKWITDIYYHWDGTDSGNNTKDWVVYIGHTEKTRFLSANNWVPMGDMIKVFDGEVFIPEEPGWIHIPLDRAFYFNNTDNMVIAVDENTPGNNWGSFFGTETSLNRGIIYYDDNNNPNPESPFPADLLESGIANIRMQFSDTAPPPAIATDVSSHIFFPTDVDDVSDTQSFVFENIGGGTLRIDEAVLSGEHPDQFEITSEYVFPVFLNTYETVTIDVVFAPTSKGDKSVTLDMENSISGNTWIQVPLTGTAVPVDAPENATATGSDYTTILLEWEKNELDNDVIIVHGLSEDIGNTEDGEEYEVGDMLPEGGTIVYMGAAESFLHEGLQTNVGHYYKAFSMTSNNKYSYPAAFFGHTICDAVSGIPLFEDFESTPLYGMPLCWSRIITPPAEEGSHWIGVSPTGDEWGTLTFYNSYATDPTLIAVTPELNANINQLSISFDAYFPGRKTDLVDKTIGFQERAIDQTENPYELPSNISGIQKNAVEKISDGITIGVISDPSDTGTFVPLKTIEFEFYEDWFPLTYFFHNYTGNAKHIAIKANFSFWAIRYIFVDNIHIEYLPSCIAPTSPEASNITNTSAQISWTPGYEEEAWQIIYGAQGFDPASEGTTILHVSETTYMIEDLQHSTQYDVYVRAKCDGNDFSTWTGPVSFTTTCESWTSPVEEDFDTTPESELPLCWSALTDWYGNIEVYAEDAYSAPNSLVMEHWYHSSNGVVFVSPEFTDDIKDLYVKFFAKRHGFYTAAITVGTMSDPADGTTFSPLQTLPLTTNWQQYFYFFNDYAGSDQYMAFKLTSSYASLLIDDIVIEDYNQCLRPMAFTAENVTADSAVLDWLPGPNETQWDIVYGTPGFSPESGGTLVTHVDAHPYTIQSLVPGTTYQAYVRSRCGEGDLSPWEGPVQYTTQPCFDEEKCVYTVLLFDSWGDGWDGTVLGFKQHGALVATFGEDFTSGTAFGPINAPLCPDLETEIVVVNYGGYPDEKGFKVYDPDGTLIYEWFIGSSFSTTTVFHIFYPSCGEQPPVVPDNITINNETVLNDEQECFNAQQIITVAGNGSYFEVMSGGSATLIAGQKISMLPGTTIHGGAWFHAYITENDLFCDDLRTIVDAIEDDPGCIVAENNAYETPEPGKRAYKEEVELSPPQPPDDVALAFRVFPNPSKGIFNIEIFGFEKNNDIRVEAFNIVGVKVLEVNLHGAGLHQLDMSGHDTGMYVIRVSNGREVKTERLVKN
jgi:hypothetical protein